MVRLPRDQQASMLVREDPTPWLGTDAKPLLASRPPSVWLLVGLQGSGKTTTTGKLAKWLVQHGHRPIVVSTDVYRPAAREQLAQVAKAAVLALLPRAGAYKPLAIGSRRLRPGKLDGSD